MAERQAEYAKWNEKAIAEANQLAQTRYDMFDYSFFTVRRGCCHTRDSLPPSCS